MNKKEKFLNKIKKIIRRDWQLYLLCIPALIYVFIFCYGPMYGVQIAFRDYTPKGGITGSNWVGLKHFARFVGGPNFVKLLKNTITLGVYNLLAGFPIPIFVALLMNQCRSMKFRKVVQTVLYAPHFISMVVLVGMIELIFSPSSGVVNHALNAMGIESVYFMGRSDLFQDMYVWSGIWQNTGWGTIIYMAALTSINPELYEAAKVDGATKYNMIWYIDIPSIKPTVITLLIMNLGKFMSTGFQKAFLMQNALNAEVSEIIATYVYKVGLQGAQFSYSTAISLFDTVINIILILTANKISKKVTEVGLF